jgi:hypothetical protein
MSIVLQFPSGLFEMAFTGALVAAGILLLGGLVSFGVFLYRAAKGDGMKNPSEAVPEKVEDDELTQGNQDDEWDYY